MFVSLFLQYLVQSWVGVYPRWLGCKPVATQRIYFANHTSRVDTLAIWAALSSDYIPETHAVIHAWR